MRTSVILAGLVLAAAMGLASSSFAPAQPPAPAAKPVHVVMIAASTEYEAEKSLTLLKEHLEKQGGIKCTLLKAVDKGNDIPGLEALERADVLIPFMRRISLAGRQLEQFKAYCQSGRAIVGVRTASHAVQTWLDFDKEVLGGNYKGHFGAGPKTTVRIAADAKDHPVLAGVKEFTSPGSLYKNTGLDKSSQVLMTGQIPDHTEPITWVRQHKGGRIFYTSLGHPADFQNADFLRLLTNAVTWTAAGNKS